MKQNALERGLGGLSVLLRIFYYTDERQKDTLFTEGMGYFLC